MPFSNHHPQSLCVYLAACLSMCNIFYRSSAISSFVLECLTISIFVASRWSSQSLSEFIPNLWSVFWLEGERGACVWRRKMKSGGFVYKTPATTKDCMFSRVQTAPTGGNSSSLDKKKINYKKSTFVYRGKVGHLLSQFSKWVLQQRSLLEELHRRKKKQSLLRGTVGQGVNM